MRIFQIQIELRGFKPKIWRRVLVPENILLPDFHEIIQISMGWMGYHLHQFIKGNKYYLPKNEDIDFWDDDESEDYTNIKLSDILRVEKDKVIYEYDFGDGWEHNIILEKILPYDNKLNYPFCIKGAMKCPPEDSGGVWGYAAMLEVLQDPKHEDYNEYKEWLREDFDPKFFDIDSINEALAEGSSI
ncbi:MAG: plasmid pRiA4b ORF-3 family protein [Bacteroidia bacterium]|nr:plasmid pRiA4b ORF-3 family protein [Bacteroidia bacterium]